MNVWGAGIESHLGLLAWERGEKQAGGADKAPSLGQGTAVGPSKETRLPPARPTREGRSQAPTLVQGRRAVVSSNYGYTGLDR